MTTLPILELGDDPFERGLIHGRELEVKINKNIDTYINRFAASGLDESSARKEGESWIEVVAKQNFEYS